VIALVFVGTLVFLYRKSQQRRWSTRSTRLRSDHRQEDGGQRQGDPAREIEVKAQVSGVVEKLYVVPARR
jgi:HlyD family secretion protein